MSRATNRQGTKSNWRQGKSKQYGVKASRNFADKSNARKAK